jgi:hypothetical protein
MARTVWQGQKEQGKSVLPSLLLAVSPTRRVIFYGKNSICRNRHEARVSIYEYWIGRDADANQAWRDYEAGSGYEHKFHETSCHLLQIEFDVPPGTPVFAFEAIFKTTKRYFHDLKQACLTPSEYAQAAPLYLYGVDRGSAIWQWLGELRQLILFGTTLGDEKVVGQTLDNMDKKLSILSKYFGSGVNPKDFDAFMRAKAAPDIEAVVRKMLKQKIKKISISQEPVRIGAPVPTELVDVTKLGDER